MKFCGVDFKNPMVIASSPLTSKIEMLKAADRAGAAAASTKLTFIKQPFYGKLRMHTYEKNGSIICYDRRLDIEEGLRLTDQAKKETNLKLFCNITNDGEDLDGWAYLAKKFEEAGSDLVEANMVCPNVGLSTKNIAGDSAISKTEHGGAVTGQNPEKIAQVVKVLKESVKIPVIVKLTPNVADIGVTAKAAQDAGADGVCLAGAQSSLPLVDIFNEGKPGYHLLNGVSHGSLGGPASKLNCFSLVANIAKKTHIPIIGGGGLETYEDCIMMMMWGATLVTVCTAAMWYGWEVIEKQVRGMEEYLQKMGYSSYDEVIGKSLQYLRSSCDLDAIPGYPVCDESKCIGCGRCSKPGHCNAITMDGKRPVIEGEKCLGCGICVGLCPKQALSMKASE